MYILLTEIGITETLGVWQNIFKIKQSSPIRTKVIIKRKKNRVSYLSFWYPQINNILMVHIIHSRIRKVSRQTKLICEKLCYPVYMGKKCNECEYQATQKRRLSAYQNTMKQSMVYTSHKREGQHFFGFTQPEGCHEGAVRGTVHQFNTRVEICAKSLKRQNCIVQTAAVDRLEGWGNLKGGQWVNFF